MQARTLLPGFALLLLPLVTSRAAAQEPSPSPAAAPQRGVAGIGGFEAMSTLLFEGVPDAPHTLATTYVFPDRVRWRLNANRGSASARSLYYRFGAQAFSIAPAEKKSEQFEGADRDRTLLQMELRRLVFFWPDGTSWSEEEKGIRSTHIGRRSDVDGPSIGSIEARVRGNELLSMRAIDGDGDEVEVLEVEAYFTERGRTWPRELLLRQEGEVVWRETVRSVSTKIRYVDRYFLPADRRPRTVVGGEQVVQSLDLQPITFLVHELGEEDDWETALGHAARWVQSAGDSLGSPARVDPVPSFELDENGRPTRCLVRLAEAVADPPEGWTTRWDQPGLATLLDRIEDLDATPIRLLRGAVPEGASPGTAYCRVTNPAGPHGVQLYLPLH